MMITNHQSDKGSNNKICTLADDTTNMNYLHMSHFKPSLFYRDEKLLRYLHVHLQRDHLTSHVTKNSKNYNHYLNRKASVHKPINVTFVRASTTNIVIEHNRMMMSLIYTSY